MADDLTREIVRELLDYDPLTGVLTWKRRARKWFRNDQVYKAWNTRFAGKVALGCKCGSRREYLGGNVLRHRYYAHRVIWLWMTGRWPDPEVDHWNRTGSDNRWVNLRETTRAINCENTWRGVVGWEGHQCQ